MKGEEETVKNIAGVFYLLISTVELLESTYLEMDSLDTGRCIGDRR